MGLGLSLDPKVLGAVQCITVQCSSVMLGAGKCSAARSTDIALAGSFSQFSSKSFPPAFASHGYFGVICKLQVVNIGCYELNWESSRLA